MTEALEFTGERFTPESVREIWYEHFHRYVFALEFVRGKHVLDAACGEGYGSALLTSAAASVTGVDISAQAVEHATARYTAPNLEFREADCTCLPFRDDEFECIVSFETLEHLHDQQGLMSEYRRVLKSDGFLLISTPDKAVYSDQQKNENEFHVSELYREQFEALLDEHFPAYRLWGQKLVFQSAIWSLDPWPGVSIHHERDGEVTTSSTPEHQAVYLLALCAADSGFLPGADIGLSLFDDSAESVYEHYYHEIRKNMAAGGLLQEKEREIEALKRALEESRTPQPWWRRLLDND